MSVFRVAAAAVALCSGLLLASFIMAEQSAEVRAHAQMNRGLYVKKSEPAKTAGFERRPVRKPVSVQIHAQMNRANYDR